MSARDLETLHRLALELIARIPEGKVMTYGQVAALVGYPGYARHVGHLLRGLPDAELEERSSTTGTSTRPSSVSTGARPSSVSTGARPSSVPWQRVVSASGHLSTYKVGSGELQKALLEAEGVPCVGGRVRLREHLWEPDL